MGIRARSVISGLALLSLPAIAIGDVFTVGPGGTHTTVQGAIDAALALAGDDEIRIATGTYSESLEIEPGSTTASLEISGGWPTDFTTLPETSERSTLDGTMSQRLMSVVIEGTGQLDLRRLDFVNGSASDGAAIRASLSDSARLSAFNTRIENNRSQGERERGGGVAAYLNVASTLEFFDTEILSNELDCSGSVDCSGGGAYIQSEEGTTVRFERMRVIGNSVEIASGSASAGGIYVSIFGAGTVEVSDMVVADNTVIGDQSGGLGLGLAIVGGGPQTLRRISSNGNTFSDAGATFVPQVSIAQFGAATTTVSDMLVGPSAFGGLRLNVNGDSSPIANVTNVTAVDNVGAGIRVSIGGDTASASVSNSIATGNGENLTLSGGVIEFTNYAGTDAGFVDAAGGDFQLQVDSPAVDAGTNSPPGGLGMTDLLGASRIVNGTVDLGAFELSDTLFADGFE